MAKRANGKGSIAQRADGRYMAQITLPSGKRQTIYAKTEDEALRALMKARENADQGVPVVDQRTTVAAYLDEWLAAVAPTMKESSARRYQLA